MMKYILSNNVLLHLRNRLARKTQNAVVFIKKVHLHPRDRLKHKTKNRKNTQNVFNAYEDERFTKKFDVQFIKKVPLHRPDRLVHKSQNEVEFIKKVLLHPRDRLARKTQNEVKFIKKVPQHPCNRLTCKTENNSEVQFMKQIPRQPRDRLARKSRPYPCKTEIKTLKYPRQRLNEKASEIAIGNSGKIRKEKYKFDLKNMLNKGQLFDLTKASEDQILDRIIEGIPKDNDEYYVQHTPGTNVFMVRKEL